MEYKNESILEKLLVEQLINQGYEKVIIKDEEALELNFRKQLYLHNKSKLNETPFTDKEFELILRYVNNKKVFDSAKILRDKFTLERDDKSRVNIEFLDTKDFSKNRFQVTTQTTVVGKYTNRYDVTLLINGLPLVQIELKSRGLDLKEAFNQIQRYRKYSHQGLYKYIQVFVISNGVDTKYFPNSDKEILYNHTFFWTDVNNKRISNLNDFASTFLEKSNIYKIITRYIIINNRDESLIVMRPYQIFAVEALVNHAFKTNENGYVWHGRGSGKRLTAFKASQNLLMEDKIKKIFFFVDRKDLLCQTLMEFNNFGPILVDRVDTTNHLIRKIKSTSKSLVVTTIQMMYNAVKSLNNNDINEKYKDEKVVFIIDECHRSQFGKMHASINEYFFNAQYFGFTGTPRFDENKSQDGRRTADLFKVCLHKYFGQDMVSNGNVLGMSIEYVQAFKESCCEVDDKKEERISSIANHIIENHSLKTRNMEYTAIFTVQNIAMLIKYYDEFKKINHNLKIAGIFTNRLYDNDFEDMIKDYNNMYNTNYSIDNILNYSMDISRRMLTGEIDIVLVVDKFLYDLDSIKVNTLYVDRELKHHKLIQAFYRTNRIQKFNKPYGNIVCYRDLRKNVDDAMRLFGEMYSKDNRDRLVVNIDEDYASERLQQNKIASEFENEKNLQLETEKEQIMKMRIGQNDFRKKLIQKDYRCKICGLEYEKFLIASHIKPWQYSNNEERLDIYNGFLLCPHHDALFDKGYITFDKYGKIIISSLLDQKTKNLMNIHHNIKIEIEENHKKYIEWHQENEFEKFNKIKKEE
ncbi:HsdR family type I site-specific deoxyribonuclease [Tepidibacter mesophilus]|uniref:HsdR family type I site-specific deoxyribonuclease n=1 Tax=Tepidibacter mesophilus TaxID=655607 RepID=UPI0016511E4B|nr:HsdR family type I site-specific deoxyribonuclease [Tepidibacter mesophilus]